ncbi:hypothetical protein B6N60_00785 [Richelia sinica FACHB-800]|uniref:Uncharacterized protein n=1 Tax=Richelia sinica FACHB-800 TaxID=1357546 RepID=A0A975T4U4_9NOST|nr:hypothetical protein B6N60_00785 [Richelia sinica FACHB-800]
MVYFKKLKTRLTSESLIKFPFSPLSLLHLYTWYYFHHRKIGAKGDRSLCRIILLTIFAI